MKVRIRFGKTGALVYIGHLDVMRYFQKLLRRSEICVKYSEGFSPHQILSFSHPLPLGMESLGEYADIELTDSITTQEALKRLKEQSVPEIEIFSFKEIPDRCENAMASVIAAAYNVYFENSNDSDKICEAVTKLMNSSEAIVYKKTKKSEKFENIRPLIHELSYSVEDRCLKMLISSGSINNLKPELVLEALQVYCKELLNNDIKITRIDQYTLVDGKTVSLDDIGKDII